MIKICKDCGAVIREKDKIESYIFICPICNIKSNEFLYEAKEFLDDFFNDMIVHAIKLASKYHSGQFDKGDSPYILHPLAVMNIVNEEDYYFNLSCKIVAVLHDIIEDTPVTKEMLLNENFPKYIVNAVDILSKKEGQSKDIYYKEVKKNPIAKVVKLADLTHNMDIRRIKSPTEKDLKRVDVYKERYNYLLK